MATPNPPLSSLLTTTTQPQVYATLLQYYQAAGFPTTAWQAGDIDSTRMMAFATALASYVTNYLPAIAGGTMLDYAPNFPGWTSLTAQELYALSQGLATYTQGTMTATNTATVPYTFQPGQITIVFAGSGNRYINTGSGTIPAATTGPSVAGVLLGIAFQAENPGAAYIDPSNLTGTVTLVTPLPGVTMSNPANPYTLVAHTGAGTGTVTPTGTTGAHSVVITFNATGSASTASWSYALDGAPAILVGITASATIGGTGITVTLGNGAAGTVSFAKGDTYAFNSPGSWITSQGANTESDLALAQRCRNRWASLTTVPTNGLYQLLATSTPGVGTQVTNVSVIPDTVVNNRINIIISGPGGILPPAVVAQVQTYIGQRVPITDLPVVQSPGTLTISIAGTVFVSISQQASAQAAIVTAINAYVASVPVNGAVQLSEIITLIRGTPGVINVSVPTVTLNGSNADLALGSSTTFVVPAYPPILTLAYVSQ